MAPPAAPGQGKRKEEKGKSKASFFDLVKTGFNQRRKTLRNACKNLFDANVLQQPIFDKRAEQLSVNDFAQLSFQMK